MFYKDSASGEPLSVLNPQIYVWSAPSPAYTAFVFASFHGSVLYQSSGICASLTIPTFSGIRIFELSSVSR